MKKLPCINCVVYPMCKNSLAETVKKNSSRGLIAFITIIKKCELLNDYTSPPFHHDDLPPDKIDYIFNTPFDIALSYLSRGVDISNEYRKIKKE